MTLSRWAFIMVLLNIVGVGLLMMAQQSEGAVMATTNSGVVNAESH